MWVNSRAPLDHAVSTALKDRLDQPDLKDSMEHRALRVLTDHKGHRDPKELKTSPSVNIRLRIWLETKIQSPATVYQFQLKWLRVNQV